MEGHCPLLLQRTSQLLCDFLAYQSESLTKLQADRKFDRWSCQENRIDCMLKSRRLPGSVKTIARDKKSNERRGILSRLCSRQTSEHSGSFSMVSVYPHSSIAVVAEAAARLLACNLPRL